MLFSNVVMLAVCCALLVATTKGKGKATPAAPAPQGPQAIAQGLVKQVLALAPTWYVNGFCPITGQKVGSAGGAATMALHVAYAASVQAPVAVAGHLLALTMGQVPGCFTKGNPTNAATFWAGKGMQLAHGYTFAVGQGVVRVPHKGKAMVHPTHAGSVQGVVYNPTHHPAYTQQPLPGLLKRCNAPYGGGALVYGPAA